MRRLHLDWAHPLPRDGALTCNICTQMAWPLPHLHQGGNLSCSSAWARQVPATGSGSGLVDELEGLARRFRDGLLTEPEFVAAKRRLLF